MNKLDAASLHLVKTMEAYNKRKARQVDVQFAVQKYNTALRLSLRNKDQVENGRVKVKGKTHVCKVNHCCIGK